MWVLSLGVLFCGVPVAELSCFGVSGNMGYLSSQRLTDYTYINDTTATVDVCALLCVVEPLCKSFNYHVLSGACERNTETGVTKPTNLQSVANWVNTESVQIPKSLAGVCENHMCQPDEQCRPLGGVATCIKVNRCYTLVDGRARYAGTRSTTSMGYTCQRWDDHTTHSHVGNGDDSAFFPDDDSVEAAANYCRSPTSDGVKDLWCYTTDPHKRWEACDVPQC
ncbi:plasminogen-like [Haliotis rubra]|uniref:plasminogen-like n=1 Tax=Haliotis rubra TaxID=36100 RepID=UPI001EE51C88|nr:plasminogen-like [Haliotis rubra]